MLSGEGGEGKTGKAAMFTKMLSKYTIFSTVLSKIVALFLRLCSYLGIPMAPDKTVGPSTTISFAGIELDSQSMEARLPRDKIHKCTTFISQFLRRKKVTLQELQSLLGLLNFACAVVKPGRAFLRRLIDLTLGIRSAHLLIRLTSEAKADLRLWVFFLSKFNGKSFFLLDEWFNSHKLNLPTLSGLWDLVLFLALTGAMGHGRMSGLTRTLRL